MSSLELYNSMLNSPKKKFIKARMMKFKSDIGFKTEKYIYSLDLKDNKNKNSKDESNKNGNCITIANDCLLRNKNNYDIKMLDLKFRDKIKFNIKKMPFFSDNEKKIILKYNHNNNNNNNNNINISNKRTIHLNHLFRHKSNFFGLVENNKNKAIISDKNGDIEKNEKKAQRILKIIPKRKLKKKSLTPNIFNANNAYDEKIQIPNYINNFKTRNFYNIRLNKSPSSYKVIENKNNQRRNIKDLKDKNKNYKLKLEDEVLNLNVRNSIIKFRKIHNNLISNISSDKNVKKDSIILENNSPNNSLIKKNNFLSEKNKKKNLFLINNKDNIKKLSKLKIFNKSRITTPEKKDLEVDKLSNNNTRETIKNLFDKKMNIKKNNIKIFLESKTNIAPIPIIEEKKDHILRKELSSGIKEIKLKSTAIRDINLIKKNSNRTTLDLESELERKKLEKYDIGEIIGKGSYATVKICTNKETKEKYAMKIYDKIKIDDSFRQNCIKTEIDILKKINHKNIVKIIEDINTSYEIIIIQEFFQGFSLKDYYNKEIKEENTISDEKLEIFKKIFKQIFEAMNYIHKKHISHRDIKMENILMNDNYEIKIIDFGFGLYDPLHQLQNFFCGTPKYMAPELLNGTGYYGEKIDLWSLGVLVYKIYCNDYPFKGRTEKDLYKSIKKGIYKISENIPDCVKNIISNLIVIDPKLRINCENVLNSSWLKD